LEGRIKFQFGIALKCVIIYTINYRRNPFPLFFDPKSAIGEVTHQLACKPSVLSPEAFHQQGKTIIRDVFNLFLQRRELLAVKHLISIVEGKVRILQSQEAYVKRERKGHVNESSRN
jgi:hypothetical protein